MIYLFIKSRQTKVLRWGFICSLRDLRRCAKQGSWTRREFTEVLVHFIFTLSGCYKLNAYIWFFFTIKIKKIEKVYFKNVIFNKNLFAPLVLCAACV